MDDERIDSDESDLDARSIDEWLARIAEAEGVSREEAIENLISSYWTLNEVFQLMEQTEESMDVFSSTSDIDLSAIAGPTDQEFSSFKESISTDVEELHDRLQELHQEVREEPGGDAAFEELKHDLDDLSARLDAFETREKYADVEDRLEDSVPDVSALEEDFERFREAITSQHRSLRDRVDAEFDNLQTILTYLVETSDDQGARTNKLWSLYDDIRRLLAERDRVHALKQSAHQLDVATAKCGYCETAIDLSLLASPYCPQCGRTFADIDPNRSWLGWFGSDTLTVTDEPLVDEGRDGRQTDVRSEAGAADGDFEWTE